MTTVAYLQSTPEAQLIDVQGVFNATPERVFRAWTNPDEVKQWFGHPPGSLVDAAIDLRVGGAWCFVRRKTPEQTASFCGEYKTIDPAVQLIFTWSYIVDYPDGRRETTPDSLVTVNFEPVEGRKTRIRLFHEGIKSGEGWRNVGNGWDAAFGGLAALFEDRV